MIRLPRFLLLLSLTTPTALGQDALPAPQPSTFPGAPTPEFPTAPEASAPVDPPASKPPLAGDRVREAGSNADSERLPDPLSPPPLSPMPPEDALPAPQPSASPAAPTLELPTTPEASALLDPLASKPSVADDRVPDATSKPDSERLPDPFSTPPSSPMPPEAKPPKESDVRQIKIVYLRNAEATTVQSIVYDIFGADVTPGVDRRTNALILSGPAATLNEALALVDKLDTAEPAPLSAVEMQKRASSDIAPREQKMGSAERRVRALMEERRLSFSWGAGKANVDDKHVESLREAIAAAFDERQAQQLAEIEELSTRLQELSKTVRGRQAKRQQMIERRLNDVLKSESPEPNELLQPRTLESSFRGVRTEEDLFSRNPVILFFGAGDDEDSIGQIALMHRLQGQGHPVELIDIRDNPNLAARFEIQQIPTVIAVRDGAERARTVGSTTLQNLYSHIVKATHRDRMPLMNESLDSIEETETLPLDYTATTFGGVLYFRADWSAPCMEFDKMVSRLKEDGAFIETIEVDKHSQAAKQYDVDVVPSLVLIREGKVHSVIKGLTSYEDIRAQFDPKSQEFRPQENIGHADSQRASGSGIASNAPPVKLSAIKFIVVNKGASLTLEADARIKSVSGFDTNVATVQVVEGNPQQLRIHGISANATTITIQQEDQEPQSYDVRVKHDTRDIEMILKQTFPGEAITVDAITETTLLLKGAVSAEVVRERAVSLAEQFYPTVLNHLEVRSATYEDGTVYEAGSARSSNNMEQDPSTESLFQSVMRMSSRAAAIKADLNGETGELRNRPKDDPRAIEVREQLNVGLAQIQAQAIEYQRFVASVLKSATVKLENAKSDLDRLQKLNEKGAASPSSLQKAEDALADAEAAVQQLTQIQELLNSITAPAEDAKVNN